MEIRGYLSGITAAVCVALISVCCIRCVTTVWSYLFHQLWIVLCVCICLFVHTLVLGAKLVHSVSSQVGGSNTVRESRDRCSG